MTSAGTNALRSAYHLARAGLFRYAGGDPEKVHELTIKVLSKLPGGGRGRVVDPVTVAGIRFPNRVGLAAGMDKDAVWPSVILVCATCLLVIGVYYWKTRRSSSR